MKTQHNDDASDKKHKTIADRSQLDDRAREVENQDAEVTDEDLQALGTDELNQDLGEDEAILKKRTHPVNFSGDDLDVPGAELDDELEGTGSEDEENNSWSIGGDNHENLEEDRSADSDDPRLG
jgi:hypothetical protein